MATLARWQATIQDELGNVMPNAEIEVRSEVDGQLALNIKPNRDGSGALGNPFNADADGFAFFYAPAGAYKITATGGAVTRIWRHVAIGTAAEADITDFGKSLIAAADANAARATLAVATAYELERVERLARHATAFTLN